MFWVLDGSGMLHTDAAPVHLPAGSSVLVEPGEVHWFENDTLEGFSFVEPWSPPPTETIWTVDREVCRWALSA